MGKNAGSLPGPFCHRPDARKPVGDGSFSTASEFVAARHGINARIAAIAAPPKVPSEFPPRNPLPILRACAMHVCSFAAVAATMDRSKDFRRVNSSGMENPPGAQTESAGRRRRGSAVGCRRTSGGPGGRRR